MTKQSQVDVPALRFPEFTEPWTEKKAGKYFASSRTKGEDGLPIYSVTQNDGLVLRDSLDRQIGVDAGAGQNLRAEKNDLVYNMMRMWQGAVGRASESCMVSPAYVVLRPRKGTDSQFFLYMFDRSRALYLLWAYSYGLTNDRLRLYYKDFSQIPFSAPDIDEQRKVSEFLEAVDKKLLHLEQKRDLLLRYKKGVMQQIFSQQVRFRDESNEDFPQWEERPVSQVFRFVRTNSLSRREMNHEGGKIQNIHYGDIHSKLRPQFRLERESLAFVNSNVDHNQFNDDSFCRPGDVVFADASEDHADCGKAIEIESVPEKQVVAGLHTILARPRKDGVIEVGFAGHMFRCDSVRRQIIRLSQGISVLGISKTALGEVMLQIPSPKEQRMIASFLCQIDDLSHSVTEVLISLKAFKKALIQKMFV